jgi:DNA primase
MDLREVAREYWGNPKRETPLWSWYFCPFHDDSDPSFGVQADHYHCFSCRRHGKAERFHREVLQVPWPGGLIEELSTYVSRTVSFHVDVDRFPPTAAWQQAFEERIGIASEALRSHVGHVGRKELQVRGIRDRAIWDRYRLGWSVRWVEMQDTWLAEGLVLPTYYEGQLWSVNVRTASGRPKYHRPRGGRPIPFGLEQMTGQEVLVICEGELDTLTTVSLVKGVDVIGLRGAGNYGVLDQFSHVLDMHRRVILALDGDRAGREAAREFVDWYGEDRVENRCPPDGLDVGKMVGKWLIAPFILEGRLVCLEL